jgi:hypothetical protein
MNEVTRRKFLMYLGGTWRRPPAVLDPFRSRTRE